MRRFFKVVALRKTLQNRAAYFRIIPVSVAVQMGVTLPRDPGELYKRVVIEWRKPHDDVSANEQTAIGNRLLDRVPRVMREHNRLVRRLIRT